MYKYVYDSVEFIRACVYEVQINEVYYCILNSSHTASECIAFLFIYVNIVSNFSFVFYSILKPIEQSILLNCNFFHCPFID